MKTYYKKVAAWVPVGAVPFFGLAIFHRERNHRALMRHYATEGAKIVRILRPGGYVHAAPGDQLPLL